LRAVRVGPGSVAGSTALADWNRLSQAGDAEAAQGDWAGAWTNYEAAVRLAPSHAGLHFKLGQCALALNHLEVARDEFTRSRDLDTLPFRADSRLNAIIAATADVLPVRVSPFWMPSGPGAFERERDSRRGSLPTSTSI